MRRHILKLTPGTRFRLADMPEVTGTLLKVSEARVAVRLDRPQRQVDFVDQNGTPRQFTCRGGQLTSWAPTTVVEPIGFETLNDEEHDMSKTKTNTAAKKKNAPAHAVKPARPARPAKGEGKLSAIDAAAKVLAEKRQPMNTREMIEAMAAKKYWTSPGGKTPHATLYSAILREIRNKGKEARFAKTEGGMFALAKS